MLWGRSRVSLQDVPCTGTLKEHNAQILILIVGIIQAKERGVS